MNMTILDKKRLLKEILQNNPERFELFEIERPIFSKRDHYPNNILYYIKDDIVLDKARYIKEDYDELKSKIENFHLICKKEDIDEIDKNYIHIEKYTLDSLLDKIEDKQREMKKEKQKKLYQDILNRL